MSLCLYDQLIGCVSYKGSDRDFNRKNYSRHEFIKRIWFAIRELIAVRPHALFAPTMAETNVVVWQGEDDKTMQIMPSGESTSISLEDVELGDIFVRTKHLANGGIVKGVRKAVALFTWDCPTIALVEGEQLAVLHGGFRQLIRENPVEENIIEAAVRQFKNLGQTRAWIGHSIGSCCWAVEYTDNNPPEVHSPSRSRHAVALRDSLKVTTSRSPFGAGHISIDAYRLITGLLLEVGIPLDNIHVSSSGCTCCTEENEKPLFWSRTRYNAGKQKVDGRNMSLVYLDAPRLELAVA